MKKWIVIAFVLVVIASLMASVYFAFAWPFINHNSNSITVTGTLESGVEAGCVILRANDGTEYLLLGWSNYPPAGTRVNVTGYFYNNVASYCMQAKAAIHVVSISTSELTTSTSSTASASVTYATGTATAPSATVVSDSTQQSITGISITISGYVYTAVESPQCYPPCGAPSFILTYLYVPPGTGCTTSMGCYPPPRDYRLLNVDGSPFWTTASNGTYAVSVTGVLVTPSSWSCDSFYVPKICMIGDIYVQSLTYATPTESITSTSSIIMTNETTLANLHGQQYLPIPGFELPSILAGLLLGLTILAATRYPFRDQETSSSY